MVISLAGADDYEGAADDDSSKLVVDHLHVDLVALVQPVEDEEHLVPVLRPLHQVHLLLLLHLFKTKNQLIIFPSLSAPARKVDMCLPHSLVSSVHGGRDNTQTPPCGSDSGNQPGK